MTISHKNLTGAELHEPKGISTASSGTYYKANGSGSGSWVDPLTGVKNLNKFARDGVISDVSTAGSNFFLVIPFNCVLQSAAVVLSGPITVADAVLTLYRDNVALGQTVTVPYAGSGVGVDTSTTFSPTYTFTAGQVLEIRSNGGSTDAQRVYAALSFTAS